MNYQYYGERFNPSDIVENTDKDTNNPAVISDPVADNVQVNETPVQDISVAETVDVAGPVDGILTDEVPLHEPPVQEIPVVETAAVAGFIVETVVPETPTVETISHEEAPISTNAGSSATQLSHEESEHFRARWNEVQGKFVDEPCEAVQQADALVSEVIAQITEKFAKERSSLESQWNQGSATEDLRKAFQRYHAFFNRLVV
jgi:hypothetical protein